MTGLPAGERVEIPEGWGAVGYFERIAGLCRPGELMETVPLGAEGKLRAARLSPRETFMLFRFADMREYLRLSAMEKSRKRKTGMVDFGEFYRKNMRRRHG